MVEAEHGGPIRPQGGGIGRLPNGRCDASLDELSISGVHQVMAVDFPLEPPEIPVLWD